MNNYSFSDCFFSVKNGFLTVGNTLFATSFSDIISAEASYDDCQGRSEKFLVVTATKVDGSLCRYCIWPDLPMVWIPEYREPVLFTFESEHWMIRNVRLRAFTDDNDTLAEESEVTFFRGMLKGDRHGEMFFFEDPESDNAVVVISEAPDYAQTTLSVKDYKATLENGGNGLALGFCKRGQCEILTRSYLRHARKYSRLVTMSNTWGDCNSSGRVCEEFIKREMDAAEDIGVDIVQIDDGWQMGDTAWRSVRNEMGERQFDGDYWAVNYDRFPNELSPVVEYAKGKGIRTGMWFAPFSKDTFSHFDRDVAVLKKAYDEWGIRFFKLDMYQVKNSADRNRMLDILRAIHSFGDDVTVQMDVTRYERLNYLCGREFGTVFVENRYTKTGNSFPHRILRNLWTISKYVPASRFQFELLNPDLNVGSYKESDPFAPVKYDMSYLFATVMLSNPLFWMEMQFLSPERRDQLRGIMSVWKEHRDALALADVRPIGEKPSGRSLTGFYATADGKPAYLLLFREVTDRDTAEFSLPVGDLNAQVLSSNGSVSVEVKGGKVYAKFDAPRTYAFIKLS